MAEALTRQGVDVTVDPGATLLKGLEDYWSDRGNDIFVNFIKKREGQNTMRSKHDGCVVATVDITEFNIGGTNIHRCYVFSRLSEVDCRDAYAIVFQSMI